MKKNSIINYNVLWDKIGEYTRKAGKVTTRPVLLLFFVLMSKETPWKDKIMILSTLSYLVLPIDIIDAKRLPVIGWSDEIASLSVAYQKVCKHITPEMEKKVDAILDKWYSDHKEFIYVSTKKILKESFKGSNHF